MKPCTLETDDPKAHAANIERMLTEVIDHMRSDSERVDDPKAQVLFETSAEVLIGVRKAYQHFARGSEKAMR
jgi:hypothetical protein